MTREPRRARRALAPLLALATTLVTALGVAAPAGASGAGFAPTGPDAAAPDRRASPRITGGDVVGDASAAYTVAIQTRFGPEQTGACSGTVLDPTHVLTAAHCVVEKSGRATPPDVLVAAGANDIRTAESRASGIVVGVAAIRVHPRYRTNRYPDDVAMLTLATPLDLTTGRVAALPLSDPGSFIPAGRSLQITGFGITGTNKDDFGVLRRVRMTNLTSGQCGATAPATMLCSYRRGHAACSGDSGGTAVYGGRLVGVTNLAAQRCEDGQNIFANLAAPEIRTFVDAALREQDVTAEQTPLSPRGREVKIAGTARVGRTLTCRRGAWSNGVRFRYTFFRVRRGNEVATPLRAKRTYKVRSSDRGRTVGCAIQVSNAGGTGFAISTNERVVRR
jgi:hypothetical protein